MTRRSYAEPGRRATAAFDECLATRPGVEQLLVELDGSELRTGTPVPAPGRQRTPVRRNRRRRRKEAWLASRALRANGGWRDLWATRSSAVAAGGRLQWITPL
jgi:hypothetical protein